MFQFFKKKRPGYLELFDSSIKDIRSRNRRKVWKNLSLIKSLMLSVPQDQISDPVNKRQVVDGLLRVSEIFERAYRHDKGVIWDAYEREVDFLEAALQRVLRSEIPTPEAD